VLWKFSSFFCYLWKSFLKKVPLPPLGSFPSAGFGVCGWASEWRDSSLLSKRISEWLFECCWSWNDFFRYPPTPDAASDLLLRLLFELELEPVVWTAMLIMLLVMAGGKSFFPRALYNWDARTPRPDVAKPAKLLSDQIKKKVLTRQSLLRLN